jgi:hypothetical protein
MCIVEHLRSENKEDNIQLGEPSGYKNIFYHTYMVEFIQKLSYGFQTVTA